jgi:hypothetical protein
MMSKVILSVSDVEMDVEVAEDGSGMTMTIEVPGGLTARLTLTESQSLELADGIRDAWFGHARESDEATVDPEETVTPSDMEQRVAAATERLLDAREKLKALQKRWDKSDFLDRTVGLHRRIEEAKAEEMRAEAALACLMPQLNVDFPVKVGSTTYGVNARRTGIAEAFANGGRVWAVKVEPREHDPVAADES